MSVSIVHLAEDLAKGQRRRVPGMKGEEWRFFIFWLEFFMGYSME